MLVSAGSDKTVRLWDAHGQRQIGLTMVADDAVESAAFADRGQKIASSDSTGTLRIYSGFLWTRYAKLARQVCGLVGTGLSPSEWSRFAPGIPYQGACR
jgi:WD40 repeat protein